MLSKPQQQRLPEGSAKISQYAENYFKTCMGFDTKVTSILIWLCLIAGWVTGDKSLHLSEPWGPHQTWACLLVTVEMLWMPRWHMANEYKWLAHRYNKITMLILLRAYYVPGTFLSSSLQFSQWIHPIIPWCKYYFYFLFTDSGWRLREAKVFAQGHRAG